MDNREDTLSRNQQSRNEEELLSNTTNSPVDMDALRMSMPSTETDIVQAMECLEVEERELRHYDKTRGHASHTHTSLHEGRTLLERRIEERRSWLSPIHKLPFEILADIISYASVTSRGYSLEIPQDKLGSSIEAPICLLSHVSIWWRTVALSLPRLWASLSVDVYHAEPKHYALVALFDQRSQGLESLKLDIVAHPRHGRTPLRNQSEMVSSFGQIGYDLLALLVQLLPRCRELHLSTKRHCFLLTVEVAGLALPFLTSFVDKTWGPFVDTPAHSFWGAIQRAPQLKQLEVCNHVEDALYPYGQVSSLVIVWPFTLEALQRPVSLLRAIGSCVQLESLTLLRYMQWNEGANQVRVELPTLRHLTLESTASPKTLDSLLNCLRNLPSLVSFECRHPLDRIGHIRWEWSRSESRSFIRLLEQCANTLQSLHLHHKSYMISTELLVMVLRATPNLTSVQLEFTTAQDQDSSTLFWLCAEMNVDMSLVPHLRELSVHEWMPSAQLQSLDLEEIVTMLETRSRAKSSLADVKIFFCKDHDDRDETGLETTPSRKHMKQDLLDRLQRLRDEGMDCSIMIRQ
ncbi:hypothetical protein VNI00_004625 [Paramarasmius palmivorus]|uniref:F-box domain-containing protein n=1 Tax=Paramarasmius palmivorus TaxID=297713 RepID=A0AAW0DFH5_9AGAR